MSSDLELHVRDLTRRVSELEDLREIAQLVAQYGPAADSGSLTAAPKLWERDGVYDVLDVLRMEGRDEIGMMLEGAGHQAVISAGCGHIVTPPHIVLDGDEATGRCHQLLVVWDKEADRFWVKRVSAIKWRWRRTSEGWRIAERTNHNLNGAAAARALFADDSGDREAVAHGTVGP